MAKGRFGGASYKPNNLGPEPAGAEEPAKPAVVHRESAAAELEALKALKVPFSSRITAAADRQLKQLHRDGHSKTALLAEALNLLFRKYGKDEVA